MVTKEVPIRPATTTGAPTSAALRQEVTQELTACVRELAGRYAEESRRSIEGLRQTIANALSQAETASTAFPDGEGAAELPGDSVARLLAAAETYANESREEGVAHACATIATLRSELEQHEHQAHGIRQMADGLKAEAETLRTQLAAQQQLTEAAQRECAAAIEAHKAAAAEREQQEARWAEDLARVSGERDAAVEAQQEASRSLASITQQLRETEEQRDRSAALLEASSLHLASVKRLNAEHSALIRDLEEKLARAGAQPAAGSGGADSPEAFHAEGDKIREQAVEFVSLSLDRLSMVFEAFGGRTTVEEVFDAVATTLAGEFSRVVLFHITPHGLEAVRRIGLGDGETASNVSVPSPVKSLVRAAAASRTTETLTAPELPSRGPFAGSATVAVAVPMALDDGPVAVVYADDADQAHRELVNPELRVKFAELVRRHAGPLLARLAIERHSLAALDSYATSLVKHLKSTHSADMLAAIPDEERKSRLSQNVAYARRVFAQRAEANGARASSVLDDQLRAAAEVQPATSFSRDIAGIIADEADALTRGEPVQAAGA